MAHYKIKNLGFQYPDEMKMVLKNINLTIEKGDFVVLCGPSGSGKTTLLRQLKRQVQPNGTRKGDILYKDTDLDAIDERQSVEEIAMIFQDPDNQIVMNTVEQELCFALENLGYPSEVMQRRIGEIVNFFGIEPMLKKQIHELSGGQKQLLNLAAVMVLRPKVLLLDEPTSQLDPIASKEFLDVLHRINQELSVTVIMSEHRLEDVFSLATQMVLLDKGKIVYDGEPKTVIQQIWHQKDVVFMDFIPAISQLFLKSNAETEVSHVPITVKEGRIWFDDFYNDSSRLFQLRDVNSEILKDVEEACVIQCKDVFFQYERDTSFILNRLNFTVHKGDFFVVLGGNGAGKSTFLKLLAGVHRVQRGKVSVCKTRIEKMKNAERAQTIGYVAQNPLVYFTCDTVRDQLLERVSYLKLTERKRLEDLIDFLQLREVLEKHPHDISGGQQQKLALALVLLSTPKVLLLDEPTKGLDPISKKNFAALLGALREQGITIVMVSHDVEFTARYASKCGMLFDGNIIGVTNPKAFFKDNYFYTTTIHRTVGEYLSEAIVLEDVVSLWKS